MLMKCGHISNAECDGKPACAICNCTELAEEQMNLEGRLAICSHCGYTTKSSENLAFFEYRPTCETDTFYCGCFGWD